MKGVEHLEDRSLLASILWDGGAGTFHWNDGDNWDTDSVPTAADDVTIGDLASPLVVDTTPAFARTVVSAERVQIPGALTLVTTSSLNDGLDLAGGTLTLDGTVTLSGSSTWSGGTLTGIGSLNHLGTLTLSGASIKSLGGSLTLTNNNSIVVTGTGNLTLNAGTLIANRAGAMFDIQSDADLDWTAGTPAPQFVNEGTLRKLAGAGTSTFDFILDNTGVFEVSSGTFSFTGATIRQYPGTTLSGGTWNVINATLVFPGGSNVVFIDSGTSVLLSGATSVFDKINSINGLEGGVFAIAGGRNFTTISSLSVSGEGARLDVGAGTRPDDGRPVGPDGERQRHRSHQWHVQYDRQLVPQLRRHPHRLGHRVRQRDRLNV